MQQQFVPLTSSFYISTQKMRPTGILQELVPKPVLGSRPALWWPTRGPTLTSLQEKSLLLGCKDARLRASGGTMPLWAISCHHRACWGPRVWLSLPKAGLVRHLCSRALEDWLCLLCTAVWATLCLIFLLFASSGHQSIPHTEGCFFPGHPSLHYLQAFLLNKLLAHPNLLQCLLPEQPKLVQTVKEYETQNTSGQTPHPIPSQDKALLIFLSQCIMYLVLCSIFIIWLESLLQFAFIFT